MKKLLFCAAALSALTLVSGNTIAGLQLCAQNTKQRIIIDCNGRQGWDPIPAPAPGQREACTANLPWLAVKSNFGSNMLNCQLHMQNGANGSAQVLINGWSSGRISSVGPIPAGYTVLINGQKASAGGQGDPFQANVSVTIVKN